VDSRDRKQAIFCVVHGGTDVTLRTESIDYLTTLPWDGYAIGGSLGESKPLPALGIGSTMLRIEEVKIFNFSIA
jgi:tRNA-guanine family transglycosylase